MDELVNDGSASDVESTNAFGSIYLMPCYSGYIHVQFVDVDFDLSTGLGCVAVKDYVLFFCDSPDFLNGLDASHLAVILGFVAVASI
jgi:hypothetical protein